MNEVYDDNYGTCKETSVSFRVMHPTLNPQNISTHLGLSPTWAWSKGEARGKRSTPSRIGIWGLNTEGIILSRDTRRHLDWLLDQLEPNAAVIASFQQQGYELDLYCLWCRQGGTGGPMLSPSQMERMARLGLTIGFEFWAFDDGDEDKELTQPAFDGGSVTT